MSGFFPDSGVTNAVARARVTATITCPHTRFYDTDRCNPRFDPAAANAVIVELLNVVGKAASTYNCAEYTNLATAVDIIAAAPLAAKDLTIVPGRIVRSSDGKLYVNLTTGTLKPTTTSVAASDLATLGLSPVDTNTFTTAAKATATGTDTFGQAIKVGDIVLTLANGQTLAVQGPVNASLTARGVVQQATAGQIRDANLTGSTGALLFMTPLQLRDIDKYDVTTTAQGAIDQSNNGDALLFRDKSGGKMYWLELEDFPHISLRKTPFTPGQTFGDWEADMELVYTAGGTGGPLSSALPSGPTGVAGYWEMQGSYDRAAAELGRVPRSLAAQGFYADNSIFAKPGARMQYTDTGGARTQHIRFIWRAT